MKRCILAVTVVSVTVAASVSFAGMNPRTGVSGSLHDMNTQTGTVERDQYQRVCVFCHTPHNATVGDATAPIPLWGRGTAAAADVYTGYTWAYWENVESLGTPDGSGGYFAAISDPLQGPTRLCLSCHDGTVAVDSHISNGALTGKKFLSGVRAIGHGKDLTSTHPVGFKYSDALKRNIAASGSIAGRSEIALKSDRFATNVTANESGYTTVERNGIKTIGQVLYGGDIFTCASCHEVHNKDNSDQNLEVSTSGEAGSAKPNYFLYAAEKDSAICLSCHIK